MAPQNRVDWIACYKKELGMIPDVRVLLLAHIIQLKTLHNNKPSAQRLFVPQKLELKFNPSDFE